MEGPLVKRLVAADHNPVVAEHQLAHAATSEIDQT